MAAHNNAVLHAMDAADSNPDDAARAYSLSDATGAPPAYVQQNQEDFEKQTKARLTADILNDNPRLRDYVNSHPLAASISNDDWSNLHDLSGAMDNVSAPGSKWSAAAAGTEKFFNAFGSILSAGFDEATKQAEERRKESAIPNAQIADVFGITPEQRKAYPQLSTAMDAVGSTPLGMVARRSMELFGGPLGLMNMFVGGSIPGFVSGALTQAGKQMGFSDSQVQQFSREMAGLAESELTGLTGRAHVGEVASDVVSRLRNDIVTREVNTAKSLAAPFLEKGETPPEGLHPLIDYARVIASKLGIDDMEKAAKLTQGTNTFARDKEFQLNHFLSLWPDSHIEIPAAVAQKLYEGKQPEVGDNVLGFVPNIKEQIENSALTGEPIQIPRNLWLTHADPEIRKALKDDARWRPGAMSNNEADAKIQALPNEMQARADVPQAEGTEGFLDGLHRVAGLETPNQMVERLTPTEAAGLDFRNIIPEGTARRINITTIGGRNPGVEKTLVGSHHFPLSAILPKLHRGQLSPELRVMSEFFGNQLERLAGDVPVTVVSKEEMDSKYDEHILGFYSSKLHRIVLRKDIVDGSHPSYFATEVVMHEAEHAISSRALQRFKPLADYLDKLRKYTLDYLNSAGDVGKAFTAKHANAFKDYDEFLVEAKSNMELQDHLHHIPLNHELAAGLRIPRGSIWDGVRLIVKELWSKVSGRVPTENVMDAIFRAAHSLEDINAKIEERNKMGDQALRDIEALRPELTAKKEPPTPEDQELFAAKALGMSQRVYRAFRDLALKRRDERARFLSEQAQKQEAERLSKEWVGNEAAIRDLVRDHVMHLPDIAADHFLRTGELFGAKYRRSRLDGSQIDTTGLDPEHYNPTQGLKPDAIAEALGFQSGDQMLDALRNLKSIRDTEGLTPAAHINQMVDALTDREMTERYGTFQQQLLDAAKEHIFGETQYDILHEQTLHYAEKLGLTDTGFTKDDIKAMARLRMRSVTVRNIDSTKAMKEFGDVQRIATNEAAAGNWDNAFKVAQQAEIAFQVAKLHQAAERVVSKYQKMGARAKGRDTRLSIPLEFQNAIQDIYQRTGVAINRTPEDIQREYVNVGQGSLRAFWESQMLPEVMEPDRDFPAGGQTSLSIADFLMDPNYRADWKNMSWEEFGAVWNSLDSLYVNGRKAGKVEMEGVTYDRQELLSNLVDLMYDVFKSDDPTIDRPVDPVSQWKTLWAGLLQMETLWTRLARGDPNNLFMKVINMPTMRAGNQLSAWERQFSREWMDIGEFPKDLMKTVTNDFGLFEPNERHGEIPDVPMKLTVRNLLAILQNVGNWSNFDKLTRGYGLGNAQIRELWQKTGYKLWMKDPMMEALFRHTTKEDWDRAQALGDLFERMFSIAENVYYDMGQRPGPRIELRSIETPFGTYKGWYHPIIYDSQRPSFWVIDPETGERKQVSRAKVVNPMDEAGFYATATPSGHMKARTGYAAPLLLNFDAVPGRMKQIINDMAMRPIVTELNKIFGDPRFKTAMSKTYGPEYAALLKPYLRDISGQRRYIDPLAVTGGRVAEYMYTNMVSTMIGLNPGTVAKHFLTATENSVNEVGAREFWKEFANTWLNPLGWKNAGFVLHKSDEVARRMRNSRESLTGAYEELFPGASPAPLSPLVGEKLGNIFEKWRQAVVKYGAMPVAISDLSSVVPMWNVVYKREIRAGETEGSAIEKADLAVRRAHGSTSTTARAEVLRGPVGRAISPFYNFFSDMLQRQYETAWRAKDAVGYMKDGNYQKGREEMKKVAAGVWAYILWPAMVEQAISPIIWNEDDDNYLKQGSEIIANDVASSFPIIRDVVRMMLSGEDPSFSIWGSAYKNMKSFYDDVEKGELAFNDEKAGKTIKHTATMIGTVLGLSNAQMGRWGQFAYEYSTGQQDPDSPFSAEGLPQWYRALRFGDIKERKR